MSKIGLWFYLSLKRQTKRIFFLLLLFLLPVGLWCFREARETGEDTIAIALYTGESDWNRKVAEELLEGGHSFQFYISESEEELRSDVAARKAECGYIFPEDLKKQLESGNYKRSITLVTAPSTTVDQLSSEVVFSGLFSVWGRELLKTYSREGSPFQGDRDIWKQLEPLYDKYLKNGSTFSFQYETERGMSLGTPSMKQTFPARGMAAVFIFIVSLTAGVTACEDERRGLFSPLAGVRREAAVIACLTAPVFLACVSGFAGLWASGEIREAGIGFSTVFEEAVNILFYGGMCTLFSWALCRIVKNPLTMACLIPFFMIGSLVFCPVFVDLSLFLPAAKMAGKFFLPYYYLT